MGAHEISLHTNDTAMDVRGNYADKLRRGKTNEEAFRELMGDEEEEPSFGFALADIQFAGTILDRLWHPRRMGIQAI